MEGWGGSRGIRGGQLPRRCWICWTFMFRMGGRRKLESCSIRTASSTSRFKSTTPSNRITTLDISTNAPAAKIPTHPHPLQHKTLHNHSHPPPQPHQHQHPKRQVQEQGEERQEVRMGPYGSCLIR